MLFNLKKNRPNGTADCLECEFFKNKKCNGLGKICFEFDEKTRTLFDPITKLPLKVREKSIKEKKYGY